MSEAENTESNVPESMINDSVEMDSTQDEEGEEVVTLTDALTNVINEEEEALMVLGAVSDKKCSYAEGYMKRQALYSCLTCIPEAKTDLSKAAGICLACSYLCHDKHDLVELYTKRNFRCDCGNSKFSTKCNLEDEKSSENEQNQYNQNFQGTYCICNRPYPDPEDKVSDEMIQCIVCEDWYHGRHLGVKAASETFSEMVCQDCVSKHEFLLHYANFAIHPVMKTSERREVNIENTDENQKQGKENAENQEVIMPGSIIEKTEADVEKNEAADTKENTTDTQDIESHNIDLEKNPEQASPSVRGPGCQRPETKSSEIRTLYMTDINWRKQLCTCNTCLDDYEKEDVLFLLDPQDPVAVYEAKGKAVAQKMENDSMNEIMQTLPRFQLMETIAGYNDLKDNLTEFFRKFAEDKKIVREEDIYEFFDGMRARKRQKLEDGGVAYHCG